MSTIENNVTAKNFRLRAEDKNTLSQKGSMYVGTGNKSSEDPTVCETVATTLPEENSVLVKDDTQIGGLGWKNIVDVINDAGSVNNAHKAELSERTETTDITHQNWESKTTELQFEDNCLYQILGVDRGIIEFNGPALIHLWFYAPPIGVMTDIGLHYGLVLPSVVLKTSSGTFTYEPIATRNLSSSMRVKSFSITRTKEGSSGSQAIPFYYRKIR